MVVDDRPVSPDTGTGVEEDHSHDIYTVANIITVLRLILVPIFFAVLVSGRSDVVAFLLFALAASTDWLDGQIARRTGTVTELGRAFDPLVDRLLIAAGVLGAYLEQRVPLWIVLLLILRDAYLLWGAAHLARNHARSVPVIYLGKLATALLLFGFSGLILNWPIIPGIGVVDAEWLPGWGDAPVQATIWLVYAGIVFSMIALVIYRVRAGRSLAAARRASH